MRTPILLLTLSLTAALSSAGAQTLKDAQSLFNQGKWQEAASAAAALNTSDGFALAAEATTAGAGLSADSQKKALFLKAQEYADKAIEKDRNNAEAYFEKARAQGRLAQYSGILQSLGLAGDMKKNLEKALSINPRLAGAYVALGLWNANLVSKGFVATQATGANKNNVVPNFKKALELEPNNPTHRVEYVNAMLLLNARDNRNFAIGQLQAAINMGGDTYWQKRDVETARAMLAKLR
ncbi:tetratricopeptide repeat protein [Deinococcus navajonensis]|uniref:Tetratricopeptide repeat protein n=1 Tax=Deinococcus navajonensis TaxID=309884 RepID=A0ABV8XMS7_9DEIO